MNETPDKAEGFFWHVHHSGLIFEWCYDAANRANHIKLHKPHDEVELRLRLLKPVKGELPQPVVEAWLACRDAYKAYSEATSKHSFGCVTTEAVNETGRTHSAYVGSVNALYEAMAEHAPTIDALHAQECPNCPWDGKTIFPVKKDKP